MSEHNRNDSSLETAWREARTQGGESLWDIADKSRTLLILLRHLG